MKKASDLRAMASQGTVRRPRALMRALEPRIMFDGAVAVTVADAVHSDSTQHQNTADTLAAADKSTLADSLVPVPVAPPAEQAARHQVVFVDARVTDYQALVAGIGSNAKVVILDANSDGLQQMATYLAGRNDIDAIHIFSHGDVGKVELGNAWVDSAYLSAHVDLVASVGHALTENGDILLYGCYVGADGVGMNFLQALASETGADVAASTDLTGAVSKGGDWVLEAQLGAIETAAFQLNDYDGLLTAFTDTLGSDPIGGGAHAATFTQTLGGVSYTYTFGAQGEGGDMVFDAANGSGNSSSLLVTSLSFNASTTERITIERTDTADFTFNTFFVNNSGGQTVSVGGYLNGSLVGSAQTVGTGLSSTLSFGGLLVDQVRVTSTDFFNTNLDNFSGDTSAPLTVTSVDSSTTNGTYKVGDTVSVQVNFSAAVTVTGTPQLTLETGTTDRVVNYASGSGTSALTFTYTVQAGDTTADLDYQGTTALALNSGTIKDGLGTSATLTLATTGAVGSLGANKAIVIDGVAPTVTSVNSSTTNGSYKAGDTVSVQVNFSEAVTVTGTPQLTLETGTTDQVVNYASGSGTSTLTFTYTVQAGDTSADLDYQSTTALALNGGTIKDAAGNVGTLTLASPGAPNSLGNNRALVIDAAPVLSNLNGDRVAWAGVGSTVVLDASSNASLTDTEFGALNGGNGDWAGASLTVQRSGPAIPADTLGFDTSGALFTVSGGNLQSGGLTFATFTNSSGVLTISYTSSGTAATTALVNDVAERITYRNDTPSGDATLRFALSDGVANTTADVTVASDSIYVTNSTDTATIDITNGVSFSEAIGIAAADVTGSQTIVFASSLASTALTVSTVTLSESLSFDMDAASGMSLTGGSIGIGSGQTLTLSNGTGDTATVSSVINGSLGALTKAGAGTVTLSNTNSYTGVTTVSAGTLAVSVANAISTGSSVSVSSGATWSLSALQSVGNLSGAGSISLGSSTLSTRVTADSTFSGAISGTGPLNINQTGAATFALTLSGTNTFTGATTLQNFAWLKLDGDAAYSNSSALRVNGNSRLTLLSDQTVGSIASNAGTARLDLGSFTLSAGGDNTNTSVTGVISGTGGLTKQGSGTLTLSGTNTYTGFTTVSAGTLSLNGGAAIVDTNAVTVASGATLNLAASEAIGSLAGAGSVTQGATTLTTGGANTSTSFSGGISGSGGALTKTGSGTFTLSGTNSYTGATLVSGGTLSVASDSNLGSGTLTLATGTTLALTGAANVDNAIALSGDATVTTSANATLSGNITGAGGLTKAGSSTLTLSGTDSFTGATSVSAGTLLVNGALSGTSGMTIASSATLGGTGSIFASSSTNTLTIQSGGTLSPGNGAGTITVNGNLSMASGSTLAIDINGAIAGTGYDRVTVNGTANVSGATLSVTHGYTAASGDTYDILLNDASDSITGSFSGLSEGSTLTAGGDSVHLTASYIGATGNDFSLTAPTFPSVTSISTISADGTYKLGDTITLVVNFSEVIHLSTGTIQLTLETGTVDRAVGYVSGSGTSTLYFDYVVQPGDHSIDLDYVSTAGLNANGDTIQSGSFQDAILTLPAPGASGSIAAGAALVVDGIAPTASIVVSDNSLTVGETSLVTVTFSEAVTGFTNADLTIANGTLTAVTTSDGGITWTATLTPTASTTDATNLITLANTGVQDVAGNLGAGTTNSNNYAIDTARPIATIVVADTSLTIGETSLVTITFSEAVTGFTNADLTVANGTLTAVTTGDGGITWTATLTPTASTTDATNLITLDNTGVQDVTGNAGTGVTNSNNYAIDNVRPTATIVVADSSLTVGETSLVTITFSEAVTGFANADLTVASGTLTAVNTGDGGITWTATLTPTASTTDATNLVTLANTGVQDIAGNAGTGSTDSNNYAIDTARPTAGIVVADTSLSIGETSLVTITFSEAVTGFTNADLSIANGTLTAVSTSDGGITWTATLTPTASTTDATNLIALDNTGVQDVTGNTGVGTTNSNNYAIDNVRPTASIVVADNSLTVGETSLVTVTFSEAVTGFTNADLSIANGTLTVVTTGDGGITWTATLTPTASTTDATNLITLANTGVQDVVGNLGAGTTNSNTYAIDNMRPTASIVVADNSLTVGETSLVTVTFSEAVTGFTNADLTIANGTLTAVTTGDGGITWTATLTPTTSTTDATNLITLANTGVQDVAGNLGAGTTNSNNYAIDTARPIATIVVADTSLTIGETSLVTITFSEAVTGFTNADLTVANGTLTAVTTGDGGITWTATLTPTASTTDATNLITLANTGVQDVVGNLGAGTTNSNNYAIDNVRPTASIVVADNSLTVGETSLVTVTFSEAATGFTNADLSIANGTLTAVTTGDGGITWTATFTPTASTTDATNLITLDNTGVQDVTGNAGTGVTNSNNYAIDNVRPSASIVVADASLIAGETSLVTVTFNEAVTGFTNADLTIANGTLTAVTTGDGGITWTATLTPTASTTDATNLIALDNTGVQDIAGNAGTGVTNSNNYAIDNVAPAPISLAPTGAAASGSLSYTISFSEAVSGVDIGDFTLAMTGSVTASVSAVTAIDASTYSISIDGIAGVGTLQLGLNSAATGIRDVVGNAIPAGGLMGSVVTVDTSVALSPVPTAPPPTPIVPTAPPASAAPIVAPPTPTPTPTIVSVPIVPVPVSPLTPTLPTAPLGIDSILQAPQSPASDLSGGGSNANGSSVVADAPRNSTVIVANAPYIQVGDVRTTRALQSIPDLGTQSLRSGQDFSFTLPRATFASNDSSAAISVDVRQTNGQPLPVWMRFDPVTGVLSGKPPVGWSRVIKIEIVARDSKGNRAGSVVEFDFKSAAQPGADADHFVPRDLLAGRPAPELETRTPANQIAPRDTSGTGPQGRSALDRQFAQFGKTAHDARGEALLGHLRTSAQTREHLTITTEKS